MNKFFYYRLEVLDGEHEYYQHGIIEVEDFLTDEQVDKEIIKRGIIENWEGDISDEDVEKDSNVIYVNAGTVAVSIDQTRKIPKAEFDVLKKFIHVDDFRPSNYKEKVEFT